MTDIDPDDVDYGGFGLCPECDHPSEMWHCAGCREAMCEFCGGDPVGGVVDERTGERFCCAECMTPDKSEALADSERVNPSHL